MRTSSSSIQYQTNLSLYKDDVWKKGNISNQWNERTCVVHADKIVFSKKRQSTHCGQFIFPPFAQVSTLDDSGPCIKIEAADHPNVLVLRCSTSNKRDALRECIERALKKLDDDYEMSLLPASSVSEIPNLTIVHSNMEPRPFHSHLVETDIGHEGKPVIVKRLSTGAKVAWEIVLCVLVIIVTANITSYYDRNSIVYNKADIARKSMLELFHVDNLEDDMGIVIQIAFAVIILFILPSLSIYLIKSCCFKSEYNGLEEHDEEAAPIPQVISYRRKKNTPQTDRQFWLLTLLSLLILLFITSMVTSALDSEAFVWSFTAFWWTSLISLI
eukprot:c20645_g1_i1.p1 GENE.c20645_g1_i1~~c20645_g1_i1.p1  ORF type:complete len:329 (-),score=69.96 c20645_g1_i1:82-1068(-)